MRILITGAAGVIGTVLRRRLAADCTIVGVDARASTGIRRVNATDLEPLERELRGIDVIVDLASIADHRTSWSTVMTSNLPATATVLEAARRQGVRRVIFASSNHVMGLYERDEPYSSIVGGDYSGLGPGEIPLIGADWPIRPDGPYAVGKALGEAACRMYSECYGISTFCLRIGTVTRLDRPTRPREFATLLSHDDLAQLVTCAVNAPPELLHGTYFGVSANTWRFWDIENACAEIGYTPRDDTEEFRNHPVGKSASSP